MSAWRRRLFRLGEDRNVADRMQSRRPDLSKLDDPASPDEPELTESSRPPTASFALLFGAGGAVLGSLTSFLYSSIMTPSCFADSCFLQYSLPFAGIGCVVGIAAGLRTAGARTAPPDRD